MNCSRLNKQWKCILLNFIYNLVILFTSDNFFQLNDFKACFGWGMFFLCKWSRNEHNGHFLGKSKAILFPNKYPLQANCLNIRMHDCIKVMCMDHFTFITLILRLTYVRGQHQGEEEHHKAEGVLHPVEAVEVVDTVLVTQTTPLTRAQTWEFLMSIHWSFPLVSCWSCLLTFWSHPSWHHREDFLFLLHVLTLTFHPVPSQPWSVTDNITYIPADILTNAATYKYILTDRNLF